MTIKEIEQASGVGSTTLYGWRDGRWTRDPSPTLVDRFCDGLGVSRPEAYRALNWGETRHLRKPTAPIIEDPDVRALMRKLNDPKTSAAERLLIRRTIKAWVGNAEEE